MQAEHQSQNFTFSLVPTLLSWNAYRRQKKKQKLKKDVCMDFEKLDKLKTKLDTYRPLSNSILQNLHEDLVLRWTYHSNAIEGNTLCWSLGMHTKATTKKKRSFECQQLVCFMG